VTSQKDTPVTPHVLFLCTGNAARSVMAGAMLEARGMAVRVTTAGTHVVEHQPISVRTREALRAVGLAAPAHRSRQLTDAAVAEADLVVAMAAEHVGYVRRRHGAGAGRTATLPYLASRLAPGAEPLARRVGDLDLTLVDPAIQGDIADPAGGDTEEYLACALELEALVAELASRLG
jgi:protein-tyrosine-phosphatase